MFDGKVLESFTALVLSKGVNLQRGQGLEIVCPVEKADVAEAFTKTAYQMGAKIVRVRWEAEKIDKLTYIHAQAEALTNVPKWLVMHRKSLIEEGFCYVAISAEDPAAFAGVPSDKIAMAVRARSKALKKFFDCVMANGIRWCVVSVPTEAWAKQVFPNSKNPIKDLSVAIERAMRLDTDNPVLEWENHLDSMQAHADKLNAFDFEYLVFKNGLGTNLKVGLADGHKWLSAKELAKDGLNFVANMPTEEVFTAPHRLKVEGVLRSAMPLSYNGQIIDNFTIEFKRGKIVSFSAEKGYETLKELIETDKGTRYLGEVALIGKNSPIAKSGILFFNTLFDENASCHLAIGKAYPTTLNGGETLSKRELAARGANNSVEHVDFMIGTPDLSVTGITKSGEKIAVFVDGEWAF